MQPDAYFHRLGLLATGRPADAALLLSREEHDELLSLAARVLLLAGSHLLRQKLVDAALNWFEELSSTYGFVTVELHQLQNQSKDTIHIEARARYALVSLFCCMIHDETPTHRLPSRASDAESDSFSRLCDFLRTSLDEEEQIYWDNIVLFLCDTLAWVCNVNIKDDDADLAWVYSPDFYSDIIVTDNILDPTFTDSIESSSIPYLRFEQYPRLYNTMTYISRSVRGLYYHSLTVLSSLRRAEHLMQISNISCRLLQTLSSVIVDEYLSDSSNAVAFTMHTPTQSSHSMSRSRKLFKQHETLIMKLLGFTTALGNAYAQALASYYFIHAELYMMDATDEDMSLLEELISNLSEEVAVTIVRFTRAFLVEDEVQHSSETIVTWLLDTDFHSPDGKQRCHALTREYDLFRYDAFFYIMLGFISSIRSVCNYFTKEFDLHVYSFRNFMETNVPLSCVSEFLLSRFSIKRPALGLTAVPQMIFYDIFLDAYELRNDEELDILLTEFKPPLRDSLENLTDEPLSLRILRFVLTSPYFNDAYSNTSEATATRLCACTSCITPKYLASSLSSPSTVLLIGEFLAQTLGTYGTSLYLARFIQSARTLDDKIGKPINVIKAWISIFRGLKLAQEYIINTHPLALFELTDMDPSQPFCIHESLVLYNSILPSFVLVRVPDTSLSRQMNDVLAQLFGELLYSLGLASQTHSTSNTSLQKAKPTCHTLVPANTLIQEMYVLISTAHDDKDSTWACSVMIDGLLYILEAFTPLSNKYSYTDHCLLLDMMLKYGSPRQITSMLGRFSVLTAGPIVIADLIAGVMSGSRRSSSLISNHIFSFQYSLISLTSITNIIDTEVWIQLLRDKHSLLQTACIEELPADLADILYEVLIDEILCNDSYIKILFDHRQSPQRLMQLPVFWHFPPEIVAAFLSDLLHLVAEDSSYSVDAENLIGCIVDTENPFQLQCSHRPVPLRPLLLTFVKSMESSSVPIDLQVLYSLDSFQTQCQEKKTITFGGTVLHLQYFLHGVLTLAEICAYLNNVTSSLPGFTEISRYISLFEQSTALGYSGIYSFADSHEIIRSPKFDRTENNTFPGSTRLVDRWTQNTIDILVHNPILITRLISIRSTIMLVGRELARQGSTLLIKLEVLLNIGASSDFLYKHTTHLFEAHAETDQKELSDAKADTISMTAMRLLACFTRIVRTDFYEFNKKEKLHLLQYAKTRNEFLPHYQQIMALSDTMLEDDEHYLWAKNAPENVISNGMTTIFNISLADQACYYFLLAFISGRPRDNASEFMFSSSIDLCMAVLALYSSFLVRLYYPEGKDDAAAPKRSVFLRTVYLLGNFLYLNFNPVLRKASKVFPNIPNEHRSPHQKSSHFNSANRSEEMASMTDWEETIAATTLIILLHILKRSLSGTDNHTINILEWTVLVSSEMVEFFTLLLSALSVLFKYFNQFFQSSDILLSSNQSFCNSAFVRVISIQSQLKLTLHATIEAMLSTLILPLSGHVIGLKLPQYSLFMNILEAEKSEACREAINLGGVTHNKAINSVDGSLTKSILKELHGKHVSLKEKVACAKENISNLAMLSYRYARERVPTKFPKRFRLTSMKALPPHHVDEKCTSTLSFFNANDLLTLHAIHPFNSELVIDLVKAPIFVFPFSDTAFWGPILCTKNCGHALLKLFIRASLDEGGSLVQLPLPLLYLSRLSPCLEVSVLAEKCLAKRFGPNGWQSLNIYLMNSYLAEADVFLSSLPTAEECTAYESGNYDLDFLMWICDSFLRATSALFCTLNLQEDHNKASGISFSICQTLLRYIRPDKWREYALNYVETSGLNTGFYNYNVVDLGSSKEQTIQCVFECMALDAIRLLSQTSVNISKMLSRELQRRLLKEARTSLCYLVLLFNPAEYMKYIIEQWMKEPEWCGSLLIYFGSPIHDIQRSLPIEVTFIKLFDFESIFKPWLNCPSAEHLLEFFNQAIETSVSLETKSSIDSVDEIDLKHIPKDLISRIYEYQKNKCLFGLVAIITIVLSLFLSDKNTKNELHGFQSAALSLFSAASDFFYLDELGSNGPIESYSSLSGYLCYASLDIVALTNKIATAANYNSFLKLPNLHNQLLYYNFSPAHSISYQREPSLLQFLTAQTKIVTVQKRLKRGVTSISSKSIFINAFVSFLEKIQHMFNASDVVSVSSIVPMMITFYHDMLLNKEASSISALTLEKVIQGTIEACMSSPVNKSDIPITSIKALVDILAIKACNYTLSGGSQHQFHSISQTLMTIFSGWDLMLLSPKSLKMLLTDLYTIPCSYPIPDLSRQIGLLIFQILRLLERMDTGIFQLQAALAGAALLCGGDDAATIEILQSHGFSDLQGKESIKECITKYIISSPIEQAILRLLSDTT
ncbi:Hypothetical protein GLP15_1784 [Giardia lamblia P15]|uniref:Uncharacterized protein n=1 Tax=Giardia intestinalis (strain P15) TaxID=658858 RepID=E1F396_GIAIA|nr:Hypothetical protein GLP15_1784 [Giardia lamblia P15]